MQHMSSSLDPVGVIQGCSDGGQCVAPSGPLCLTQAVHGVNAIVCLPGFQAASLALVSDPPSPSASNALTIAATAATPALEWRGAVLGSYASTEVTLCLGPPAVPCRFACATDQLTADLSGIACVLPEATGAGLVASLYLNAAAPPPTPPAPPNYSLMPPTTPDAFAGGNMRTRQPACPCCAMPPTRQPRPYPDSRSPRKHQLCA